MTRALSALFAGCVFAGLVGLAWVVWKYGIDLTALALAAIWIATVCTLWFAYRTDRRWLLAIAFLPRIAMIALTNGGNASWADPLVYAQLAAQLDAGHRMLWMTGQIPWNAAYPPLYPLLLAGVTPLAGRFAAFFLNTGLDLATAALLIRIGGRPGWIAAALFLAWPSMIVDSTFPQKEALICLLVVLHVHAYQRNRPGELGLAGGLLALTQPALVPFTAALAFSKKRPLFAVEVAAISAAVLLPWWVRNWIVLGAFVPLTTSNGLNLWTNATQSYDIPAAVAALPEAKRAAWLFRDALSIIAAHPLSWVLHQAKNTFLAFGLDIYNLENLQRLVPPLTLRPESFALIMELPMAPLWLAALWASRHSREFRVLAACCFVQALFFQTWFEFGQRHRVDFVPVILLGCCWAWRSTHSGSCRSAAGLPAEAGPSPRLIC